MNIEKINEYINATKALIYIGTVLATIVLIMWNYDLIVNHFKPINSTDLGKELKKQKIEKKVNFGFVETTTTYEVPKVKNGKDINEKSITSVVQNPKNYTELYYKNQNALLKVQNPTKLKLENIKKVSWLGDDIDFYTLNIKNTSKVPAHHFKFELLLENGFKPQKTKTSNIFYSGFTIKANTSFGVPIITEKDIAKYFNVDINKILDVGFNANIPDEVSKKAKIVKKEYKNGSKSEYSGTSTRSLPLKYTYETIFGDKVKVIDYLYVYIDKN
ncbi:hypothetical protein [Arcobacter sp.]|uniref:hypothetical protein n=1 Tax=Arcobacter sp. TaxID=1872629 RepID=UPI003C76299A